MIFQFCQYFYFFNLVPFLKISFVINQVDKFAIFVHTSKFFAAVNKAEKIRNVIVITQSKACQTSEVLTADNT